MNERIRQVIADSLGLDPSVVTDSASQETVEAWDSLGHINVVLALELEFRTQFSVHEIPLLVSVTAIRDALARGKLVA